jgi:hypothetical protein
MGRPFKSGVEYFPLDVNMDDEIELIEAEHGIVGFGILIKLYQKIYANNYWIKWSKKPLIVFSKRINVDINSINDIINSCLEWGIFDRKIYEKHSVITSKGIQKRFFEIVKRRNRIEVIKEYLTSDPPKSLKSKIVFVDIKEDNDDINPVNDDKSTQSKVKESKVKESKGKVKKHTYSDEFEKVWEIAPLRNGVKQGKKDASDLFEKLDQEKKRRVYFGLVNYSDYCEKSGQSPMDLARFIRKDFYLEYQKKISVPLQVSNQPKKEKSLSEIAAEMKNKNFDIELTDYEEVSE